MCPHRYCAAATPREELTLIKHIHPMSCVFSQKSEPFQWDRPKQSSLALEWDRLDNILPLYGFPTAHRSGISPLQICFCGTIPRLRNSRGEQEEDKVLGSLRDYRRVAALIKPSLCAFCPRYLIAGFLASAVDYEHKDVGLAYGNMIQMGTSCLVLSVPLIAKLTSTRETRQVLSGLSS